MKDDLPTLKQLGSDLLLVNRWEVWVSLAIPFFLAAGFFALFFHGVWWLAILCPALLSFFTYASVSHDLVHRNLGLPRRLNEVALCLIELLTLRSGHAYRASHLRHHARFPAEDDLEGAAAAMPLWRALLDGLTLQFRIWRLALKSASTERGWILWEGVISGGILIASILCVKITIVPAIYCSLVIAGSWIYPFMTSWVVHDAHGATTLTQTRLFRGRLLGWLAIEHLYHLEHHLYPQVPHHRWPELARRLDPHFARLGLKPIKFWF